MAGYSRRSRERSRKRSSPRHNGTGISVFVGWSTDRTPFECETKVSSNDRLGGPRHIRIEPQFLRVIGTGRGTMPARRRFHATIPLVDVPPTPAPPSLGYWSTEFSAGVSNRYDFDITTSAKLYQDQYTTGNRNPIATGIFRFSVPWSSLQSSYQKVGTMR